MNILSTTLTTPSRMLLDHLKRFEGLYKVKKDGLVYPYLCPAGYPTQGYGRLVSSLTNRPISKEQAELWLIEDATKHLSLAISLSPNLARASESRIAAIASFVFNLGPGRYKASTLRKRVEAEDWEGASVEMGKWIWGGGKKLPGLVIRREVEAGMLLLF